MFFEGRVVKHVEDFTFFLHCLSFLLAAINQLYFCSQSVLWFFFFFAQQSTQKDINIKVLDNITLLWRSSRRVLFGASAKCN